MRCARINIVFFFLSSFLFLPAEVYGAVQLALTSGGQRWNAAQFLYLGYAVRGGVGEESDQARFSFHFGAKHPYSSNGFRHNLYYGSVGVEWSTDSSGFRGFGGAGIGLYYESLNSEDAFVPSLATHAGVRVGSENFGFHSELNHYLGIYASQHPFKGIAWNLIGIMVGVYAGF